MIIEQNQEQNVWLPMLASLALPGLGQVLIGQWWRGFALFFASASVCFGLGVCNLAIAYDAWALASRLREEPIDTDDSSWVLIGLSLLWKAVRVVLDHVLGFFAGFPIIRDVLVVRRVLKHGPKG